MIQEKLRRVLLTPAQAVSLDIRGAVEAAVLIALYEDNGVLGTVFTRRRRDLRRHAGEISFPGGRRDPSDENLLVTALREAHEEIGLSPDSVEVLGALQPTPTIATNYAVYPFVALISPGTAWTVSATEVEEVIELPLTRLQAGYARRRMSPRGMSIRTDTYLVDEHLIWGATARILADLFDRLGPLATDA